ncbi:MarR family transcriptional regulator [Blastococcus sp. CT_GayMR20]|uniref:MarR family winged helix-turn-helix transcriptional regulator n=1 Tax=Blastococcus sp. CT_GayMR20 TaxID=2559609 RepID=UPI001073D029|nr:MarR family transcriptional regulator [Blastococcus sp. CT_GayMR20]TFV83266.1 MarR family transcriptional regulator [Blastococcus sp. CT_GayMR20]
MPSTDEPRWLDADERAAWLALAGVITVLPAALDAQLQRDVGLSHFEYMVLAMLSERPTRTARMSELAALANGSLSRLSHVARRLENQGFLAREACAEDRRATNAVLTDAGYAKVVATAPGHVATVRQLVFDALSPAERDHLRTIGDRVLGRVLPGGACGPPPAAT